MPPSLPPMVWCGSMVRRGNPCDNAQADSFVKTLKVEDILVGSSVSEKWLLNIIPLNRFPAAHRAVRCSRVSRSRGRVGYAEFCRAVWTFKRFGGQKLCHGCPEGKKARSRLVRLNGSFWAFSLKVRA